MNADERGTFKSKPVHFLALGITGVLVCCPLTAADWPQFLGPARNGISDETGLLTAWPAQGPPVVWQRDVGEGFSGPVIAGKRLVAFHRVGEEEVVECLDATTGNRLWKFAYRTTYRDDFRKGDGPRSTPLIAAGRVFTLGPAGQLHCLDLENGKKVWTRLLNEDYQAPKGFFGVATSALLEGDHVWINVGGKNAGIVALHKDTGREVWKQTNHEASYASPVAATIDGARFLFFFTREGLVAIDPEKGELRFTKRWRSRMHASVNAATPLVVGDLLFLSASYNTGAALLRVRKDGVEEIWKGDEMMSNHYSTSMHHAGFLYGFDGRQEEGARFRCIELKTGKVRWTRENFGCGTLVLADGHLIVLAEDGSLVLVEATPEAYREKGRFAAIASPARAQIALANGLLYARDDKKLVCWNVKK